MFKSSNRRLVRPAARSHTPRREQREDVTRSATIVSPEGTVIACTVRDLHTRGARISLANAHGVPDTFELQCRSVELATQAKVAWRRGNEIGVQFLRR